MISMPDINKKEAFKLAIREFHERSLPDLVERELSVPLDAEKVVTLYGPRRVGKTYYLYQLIDSLIPLHGKERIIFINLEDERLLPLDVKDMHLLVEAYYELYPENRKKLAYLFLDEIQVVKGWETFVRRLDESRNFRILITGSSAKLMSREIATSLRGRTLPYQLLPLSFSEFLRFKKMKYDLPLVKYSGIRFDIKKALEEYLKWGGYPEAARADEDIRIEILKSYFEMIVFRDLVERFSIRNSRFMKFLLKYLLTNISNLFSVNRFYCSLESGLKSSRETLQDYLSHVLESEIIFLIPKFAYSLKVQEKNPKKIYCLDNGLRHTAAFLFSKDIGRLAENLVFLELLRRGYEVHYWKNKREVDFIAQKEGRTLAINVCYEDSIPERETEGLKGLKDSDLKADALFLVTRDTDKELNNIRFVPLWEWLLSRDFF